MIAKRVATEGGKYLNLLIEGGEFEVLGSAIEILGLKATGAILEALRPADAARCPRGLARPGDPLLLPGPRKPRRRRSP